ncbi:hypothetical protein ACH5RR_033942 [Cinchona calisaya]|uniref:C2 domain-containing protein n=1 Tax=Cinchona calisaya TaxID=153742 RepID=A0ABD2YBN2_9GENT
MHRLSPAYSYKCTTLPQGIVPRVPQSPILEYNMENKKENSGSIVCRKFQLNLISARNLENVERKFRMKVYAVVSFNGIRKTEKKTPVDKENGINPAWNLRIEYNIAEISLQNHCLMVVVKLYCKRKLGGDRYIGEVHMQVRDLFNNGSAQEHGDSLSLKLQKGGSVPLQDSELQISYQFGEIFEVKERPLWRKVLRGVGVMLLRGPLIIVVGIDVPIPITKDGPAIIT